MAPGSAPASAPMIVELIGPAGVGKSTLARELRVRNPSVRLGPEIWGLPSAALIAAAVELVPTILRLILEGRRPRPHELAQMIRLGALRRAVDREAQRSGGILVLDEGPVFGLAWLDVFGHTGHSPSAARWRRQVIAEWASRLDAVIRLDAGDRILARRIRRRRQEHAFKHRPDQAIAELAARYRTAFDQVLSETAHAAPIKIDALRTDGASPKETLNRLSLVLVEVSRGT